MYNLNMESKNQVDKVKKDIKSEVMLIFGVAFFVMFLACVILLFLTESSHTYFAVKTLALVIAFVSMHIVCVKIVGTRIRLLFEPVDKYVADSDETIDILSKENRENINNILEVNKSHAKLLDKANIGARASKKLTRNINKNKEVADSLQQREEEIYDKIEDFMKEIRQFKTSIAYGNEILSQNIEDICDLNKDINADYDEIVKAYDRLNDLLIASSDSVEGLIGDIGLMQTDLSLLNTNATRLALDNARNGSYSFAMTNGLDEIKRISGKVDDRSDSISKYAMSARNSLKLIDDQADYCMSEHKSNDKSFKKNMELSGEISNEIKEMSDNINELLGCINSMMISLTELRRLSERKQNLLDDTYDESDEVAKIFNNMGECFKSK